MIIAIHLKILTVSFKNIIEKIVANTGAAKLIAIASAIGKYFNPRNKNTIANAPAIALTECNLILEV